MNNNTKFHVVISSAKMPAKVRVPYRHIAVIETRDGYVPCRIDTRPKGVVAITRGWYSQHLGYSPKGGTAAELAIDEARALAATLNAA